MATRAAPILFQLWTLLTAPWRAGGGRRGRRSQPARACAEREGEVLSTPGSPGEAVDDPSETPMVRAQRDPAERGIDVSLSAVSLEELQGSPGGLTKRGARVPWPRENAARQDPRRVKQGVDGVMSHSFLRLRAFV